MTIDAKGIPTVHDPAPGAALTVASGAYAIAVSREGDLHESTDHGRSWRLAGRSPVPPAAHRRRGAAPSSAAPSGSCRARGLGRRRVVAPRGRDRSPPPAPERPDPTPAPRLCATRGAGPCRSRRPPASAAGHAPDAEHALPGGETIEIVRDAAALRASPPTLVISSGPPRAPAPAPPPAPAPKKGRRPSPAVLRTHTLLVRPPFSPLAAVRRINATDADFNPERRLPVVPLLGPAAEASICSSSASPGS